MARPQGWRRESARSPWSPGAMPRHGARCKIHLGIDEKTLEVRTVEITGSYFDDAPVLPDLHKQNPAQEQIGSVTADGALGTRKCPDASAHRDTHAVMAPRRNAKPWKTASAGAAARNEALRGTAGIKIPRPCPLARMERISPPKPRRDIRRIGKRSGGSFHRRPDALCETARAAPQGTRLRPKGRRA